MNVEMPELLLGAFTALIEPPGEGAGVEFAAGKVGTVAILALLGAQESEKGVALRVAENRAIRELIRCALDESWPGGDRAELARLAAGEEPDLTLTGLEAQNAELRRALIALHIAAEETPGADGRRREQAILAVLKTTAQARQVVMPQQPAP